MLGIQSRDWYSAPVSNQLGPLDVMMNSRTKEVEESEVKTLELFVVLMDYHFAWSELPRI